MAKVRLRLSCWGKVKAIEQHLNIALFLILIGKELNICVVYVTNR